MQMALAIQSCIQSVRTWEAASQEAAQRQPRGNRHDDKGDSSLRYLDKPTTGNGYLWSISNSLWPRLLPKGRESLSLTLPILLERLPFLQDITRWYSPTRRYPAWYELKMNCLQLQHYQPMCTPLERIQVDHTTADFFSPSSRCPATKPQTERWHLGRCAPTLTATDWRLFPGTSSDSQLYSQVYLRW